jgi:hypothetical protein
MRPYTGTDKIATGKRAGTEAFVAAIQNASGRQVWNNGTFGVRKSVAHNPQTCLACRCTRRAVPLIFLGVHGLAALAVAVPTSKK